MSVPKQDSRKPLFLASILFFGLFVLLLFLVFLVDPATIDLAGLLFLTAFFCIALISKSVYDSLTLSEQIQRTEEQLTADIAIASEELHTQLYQNSPVPYLLIDREGRVTSANVAAGRLYGMPQKKLEGKAIFDTFEAEEPGHVDILFEKFRTGVAVSNQTMQVRRVDGEVAWVLLSLFQFTNAYSEKIGLLTLVDITRQKQIENAKTEFVSLASHQLRTPMSAIKWSAELLKLNPEKNLTDKQERYVDRLLTGVQRMAVLVDDFLRVSRFELGTFQPEFNEESLAAIINDVIKEQELRISQKQVNVKTFYEPKDLVVNSDRNLIRMITSNLLSNAVKYSKHNGVIHIGFVQSDDKVKISVADNGMGIPIKEHDRIFTKLFRASNAVRNVPDGTGLGLYIAAEAVRVLNGKITFTSIQDVSTTFEVTIPVGSVTGNPTEQAVH